MIQPLSLPFKGHGWYQMTAEEYHNDPCPLPSLSSSIAKKLLRQTPRHAWAAHPRLGGPKPQNPTSAMLFGSVTHKIVLGAGSRVRIIDAPDYRSKAAQASRDDAFNAGMLPILLDDFDRADRVAEAIRIRCQQVDPAMFTGQSELVAIWQEDGVWCRAMMDCLRVADDDAIAWIDDLKTSGQDIGPSAVGKTIANMGYDLQAAFYQRAVTALDATKRAVVTFGFAETDPPYEATIVRLDGAAMEIGRRQVCAAVEIWRRCLAADSWPGYPADIVRAELPPWHTASWEARETLDPLLEGVTY